MRLTPRRGTIAAPLAACVALGLFGAGDGQARVHRPTPVKPPPVPAVCANANIQPSASDLSLVGRATICLINRARLEHGVRALAENRRLDRAAAAHSDEMVVGDYFNHVSPTEGNLQRRALVGGYIHDGLKFRVGENLAIGTTGADSPSSIVAAWLGEPSHRAVILNPIYRETGVGVAAGLPARFGTGRTGTTYTQDFGVVG